MSRFVTPRTRTLTLANGDQLIVRERLTAGEQRARLARMYTAGERREFSPLLVPGAFVVAYLLDWTLRDADGRAVRIQDLSGDDLQNVLDMLDEESFTEIFKAIEAHEKEMAAARELEKKTDGAKPLSPTSPLLVVSGGATNG